MEFLKNTLHLASSLVELKLTELETRNGNRHLGCSRGDSSLLPCNLGLGQVEIAILGFATIVAAVSAMSYVVMSYTSRKEDKQ